MSSVTEDPESIDEMFHSRPRDTNSQRSTLVALMVSLIWFVLRWVRKVYNAVLASIGTMRAMSPDSETAPLLGDEGPTISPYTSERDPSENPTHRVYDEDLSSGFTPDHDERHADTNPWMTGLDLVHDAPAPDDRQTDRRDLLNPNYEPIIKPVFHEDATTTATDNTSHVQPAHVDSQASATRAAASPGVDSDGLQSAINNTEGKPEVKTSASTPSASLGTATIQSLDQSSYKRPPSQNSSPHQVPIDPRADGSTLAVNQVESLAREIENARLSHSGAATADVADDVVHVPAETAPSTDRNGSRPLPSPPEDEDQVPHIGAQLRQVYPSVLHPGIFCGSCWMPVYNVHFRCAWWPDWYLCRACVWLLPTHVQSISYHVFKPYEYSQNNNTFHIAPPEAGQFAQSKPSIELSGTEIRVSWRYMPWRSGSFSRLSSASIPKLAEKRIRPDGYGDNDRGTIWGLVQVASSGVLSESDLFRSSGAGACYTLTPPWRSPVPLQWVHVGPGAIPNSIADIPCDSLTMEELLAYLNDVLGTSYTLDMPGLRPCLEHAHLTSHDLGQLYGTLRSWWSEDFTQTLERMKVHADEVQRKRDEAIHDSCIQDCQIPPRRIWDLRSNRVLPTHVIPPAQFKSPNKLPENLWTVSHSWVDEKDREGVMTAINDRQWPVPIPRKTSLDHVRIELLNMGAEYIWLDALCLRQEGGVDENRRFEEWKLDVPTIGHVFQAEPKKRPCITYYNGLGLPLDASPATLQSIRHWFKRVWTLQESLHSWLPGGLTADPGITDSAFFSELDDLLPKLPSLPLWYNHRKFFETINIRHCTTELDRIAGLGYPLGCKTLPLYDRKSSVESAWTLLIKHMDSWPRTFCFLQYPSDTPFGLWMSAKGLLTSRKPAVMASAAGQRGTLQLVDPNLHLHTDAPGYYYHIGYALGPCHITRSANIFHFQFEDATAPATVRATTEHGIFLPTVAYTLVGISPSDGPQSWIVIEVVGEREVQGETALEAVKWGVIYIEKEEAARVQNLGLHGRQDTRVVYLSSDEALARSKHVDEYMQAFREATASNKKAENTP